MSCDGAYSIDQNGERLTQKPWGVSEPPKHSSFALYMAKIRIFFRTSMGSIEDVAYKIASVFGKIRQKGHLILMNGREESPKNSQNTMLS